MNFNGCIARTHPSPGCSYVAGREFDTPARKVSVGDRFSAADVGAHDGHVFEWWKAGWVVVAETPEAAEILSARSRPEPRPERKKR